ncbi:MAG: LysR family transcriptional regulator substrate-binding protein, partial [Kiritimatiellae bacterium]|nr:LysR family transcriptional regulator substrate-binding protein [Kiritimatiellia bacterium]
GCNAIVEDYIALEASLSDQQLKDESPVSVAAIYSVGLGDMQQILNEFRQRSPNSKVRVEYLHPDRVWEHVLNETADLGLLSFPRKSRDIIAHPWREEAICLACSASHPLASNRDVDLQQLDGEAYVAFDRELVIRRKIDRYLRDDGVKVDITMEFDNIESIKKAVSLGQGLALLPRPSLIEELNTGALVAIPLRGAGLVRPLGLIHHRHRLSPSAQKFADLLLESSDLAPTGSPHMQPLALSPL